MIVTVVVVVVVALILLVLPCLLHTHAHTHTHLHKLAYRIRSWSVLDVQKTPNIPTDKKGEQ